MMTPAKLNASGSAVRRNEAARNFSYGESEMYHVCHLRPAGRGVSPVVNQSRQYFKCINAGKRVDKLIFL